MKIKFKKFFANSKKYIISGVVAVVSIALILSVAIATTSSTDNGLPPAPDLEINKEENIVEKPDIPTSGEVVTFKLPLAEYEVIKDFSSNALKYNSTLKQWEAHKAVDLKAEAGASVYSVLPGKIESIKNDYLKGTMVTVVHNDGFKTVYASLSEEVPFKVGDSIVGGDVIGYVSVSAKGESLDGAHLHFEMYKDSLVVDPNLYITFDDK